jgi:hypothetical protein
MIQEEPTSADLAARWPRWEAWQGIDRLWHARIKGAIPPVMVHGEDIRDLMDQIQHWEGTRE